MMFIIWILLISLLVFFGYKLLGKTQPKSNDESINILRQRYANGEIDDNEFERQMQKLSRE